MKDAVKEALKEINLVDGPTHIAHHQALEEVIQAKRAAAKFALKAFIGGIVGLIILGLKAWIAQ